MFGLWVSYFSYLQQILAAIREQVQQYILASVRSSTRRQFDAESHQQVLEAIIAGNAEEAGILMRQHLQGCKEHYVAQLPPTTDTGVNDSFHSDLHYSG